MKALNMIAFVVPGEKHVVFRDTLENSRPVNFQPAAFSGKQSFEENILFCPKKSDDPETRHAFRHAVMASGKLSDPTPHAFRHAKKDRDCVSDSVRKASTKQGHGVGI